MTPVENPLLKPVLWEDMSKIFTKVTTTILHLAGNLVENQLLKLWILLQILFIEQIVWILLKIIHPSFSLSHVNLVANFQYLRGHIKIVHFAFGWWKCSRRTFYIICSPSTYLLLMSEIFWWRKCSRRRVR